MQQDPTRLAPRGSDPARLAARDALEADIISAITAHRILLVRDAQGHERKVQPHALFRSTQGNRQVHCYQFGGYSSSGKLPMWRNLDLPDIEAVTVTDERFKPRPDFNPDNPRIFGPNSIEVMVL